MPMQTLWKNPRWRPIAYQFLKASILHALILQRKPNAQFNSPLVREQSMQKLFQISLLFLDKNSTKDSTKYRGKNAKKK